MLGGQPVVVLSPDVGGMKRAEAFRQTLASALGRDLEIGFMGKRRVQGKVAGDTLFALVENKVVVIIDDLISTGTTMGRAARACLERGAATVYAAASHGLFIGGAEPVFGVPTFAKIVVTDTVPPFRLDPGVARKNLVVLTVAPLFAGAIHAIHTDGSVADLLGD